MQNSQMIVLDTDSSSNASHYIVILILSTIMFLLFTKLFHILLEWLLYRRQYRLENCKYY